MANAWTLERTAGPEAVARALCEHGLAIIPHAIGEDDLERLNEDLDGHFEAAQFCEGLFYGTRTKRFGRLLSRAQSCRELVLNDLVIAVAREILGQACEGIQLNLTQAIEIWPESPSQVPHRDQDIWLGNKHPGELMLNAMWALDNFTPENGATLVWPGSHLEKGSDGPNGQPVAAQMPKGSVCLFLGSTLHCGGANWSRRTRRGLVTSYCVGWLKPCENPWLTYPPEVAREFPAELSELIGYRMDAPSLNNVDGRCPSELLRPGVERSGFADRLTEEQVELIRQFNSEQMSAHLESV